MNDITLEQFVYVQKIYYIDRLPYKCTRENEHTEYGVGIDLSSIPGRLEISDSRPSHTNYGELRKCPHMPDLTEVSHVNRRTKRKGRVRRGSGESSGREEKVKRSKDDNRGRTERKNGVDSDEERWIQKQQKCKHASEKEENSSKTGCNGNERIRKVKRRIDSDGSKGEREVREKVYSDGSGKRRVKERKQNDSDRLGKIIGRTGSEGRVIEWKIRRRKYDEGNVSRKIEGWGKDNGGSEWEEKVRRRKFTPESERTEKVRGMKRSDESERLEKVRENKCNDGSESVEEIRRNERKGKRRQIKDSNLGEGKPKEKWRNKNDGSERERNAKRRKGREGANRERKVKNYKNGDVAKKESVGRRRDGVGREDEEKWRQRKDGTCIEKERVKYKEFLEMKKWRMQLLEEKLHNSDNFSDASSPPPPTTIFASTPRQSLEVASGKPFFSQKDITEVLSVLNVQAERKNEDTLKMEKIDNHNHVISNGKMNLEEIISFSAHPQQYPNLSASALDEGYSTSSQNGWPIGGNPSLSPPPSVAETFDDAYDTSSKSGTITKKEQEDLQDLLRTFEESSSSGSEGDEEHASIIDTSWEPGTKLLKENSVTIPKSSLIPEPPDEYSVECHRIDTDNLSVDIKNAVNELLSIGSGKEQPLLNEQTSELDELGDSYENLLENLSIFAQTGRFEVLVDSSDFSAVSSISDSEDNLFETNDSGIDDSMPGVTTKDESSVDQSNETIKTKRAEDKDHHKSKDGGHRKHRKHRNKETSLHRSQSHSEPRSANIENGDEKEKSGGSLPRPKKHDENGDVNGDDSTESVSKSTVSNGEPKKLRVRKDREGGEHHKRRSRSRDRISEADEEGEDGQGSKHRKRSSRSRERKSEDNGVTNDDKDDKAHRKRRSRSRERKTEANDEAVDGKDRSEHRKRSSRSRERKSEETDETKEENGEPRKRKSRSRDKTLEINGDVNGENENSEERKSRKKSINEVEEKKEHGKHRKQRSRSHERKPEVNETLPNDQPPNPEEHKVVPESSENRKTHERRHKSSVDNVLSEEPGTNLTNGEATIHRSDNKKERRSEPTTSKQTSSDGSKHKSRTSEPVIRSSSNAKRQSANPKKKPLLAATVVKAVLIEGPKEVIIKTQDGLKTQDGAVVQRHPTTHIDSASSEYMYETPDGKHCVYLRPKEEEQHDNENNVTKKETKKKVEKKETNKSCDQSIANVQNTSIVDYGKRVQGERKPIDDSLSDKYGISSDIISLLREEEKFWQKQQELKEWRVEREFSNTSDPERRKSRAAKSDLEIEEDKLEREAKRLERLRIHQENLIKTFQDNLLREEMNSVSSNNDHLPYQTPYTKPPISTVSRTSFPPPDPDRNHGAAHYDLNNTDVGHGILHHDPKTLEKNYKQDKRTNTQQYVKLQDEADPTSCTSNDIQPKSSSHRDNISPSSPNNRNVCFSDDDEVFHESRRKAGPRKEKSDYRGYFSDPDVLCDNSIPRTYLARPLVRQTRTNLRCTACCKPISDERLMYVEGQNFYWHLNCFLCVVCNAFLNDRHTIRVRITNYKLHCRFCYSSKNGEQLSEV